MTDHSTAEVGRIARGLTKAQREFVIWLSATRHIDVVSTSRLLLVREGVLHVETRDRHLYASLTPLGLAVRAHLEGGL